MDKMNEQLAHYEAALLEYYGEIDKEIVREAERLRASGSIGVVDSGDVSGGVLFEAAQYFEEVVRLLLRSANVGGLITNTVIGIINIVIPILEVSSVGGRFIVTQTGTQTIPLYIQRFHLVGETISSPAATVVNFNDNAETDFREVKQLIDFTRQRLEDELLNQVDPFAPPPPAYEQRRDPRFFSRIT